MIWVAWRQHRAAILAMLLAIVLAAAFMVYNRFALLNAMDSLGATGCFGDDISQECEEAFFDVRPEFVSYISLWPLAMQALPILGGAIVGAPLFGGELSSGSHMFSLTQSISRKRWWATKLTVVLLPLLLGMLALGAVSQWAFRPFLDFDGSAFNAGHFDTFGLIPAAYFLLTFAAASTLGLLWKSIVGPIVVAVLVSGIIAATITLGVRPHYMEPHEAREANTPQDEQEEQAPEEEESPALHQSFRISEHYVKQGADSDDLAEECADIVPCIDEEGYDLITLYHPIERLWTFQGIETGIYTLLAAGMLSASAVTVRKRLP